MLTVYMHQYKGLLSVSAKDQAKTFMVRFAFIVGKRLTRNLKIQSQAKAAAPHYEVDERVRRCNFLHHVSPLGLDKDQVLTMIKSGRAAKAKHWIPILAVTDLTIGFYPHHVNDNDIDLQIKWLPREHALMQCADDESKEEDPSLWALSPWHTELIQQRWAVANIAFQQKQILEVFGEAVTAKYGHFFSRALCPGTSGIDGFA
eukprot:jgi/Tetstr1/421118/TSEL_012161.t1